MNGVTYDFLKNEIEVGDTVVIPHKHKENSFDIGIVKEVSGEWVFLLDKGRKRQDKCIVVKKVMQNILK